jgi:hypothetical protein
VSVGQLTVGPVTVGQLTVGPFAVGYLTVGQLTVGQWGARACGVVVGVTGARFQVVSVLEDVVRSVL